MLRFLVTAAICVSACQTDPLAGLTIVTEDPTDLPLRGLPSELSDKFDEGDALFEQPFRESQGLGPYYIRHACAECHADDSKGPGSVTKMVVVEADGLTPASDQSLLPFGSTVRPQTAAGGATPLMAPEHPEVKTSIRLGPAVFGRGYIEAIADSEIERVAAEQAARGDAITGRVNYTERGVIGRFGVKARVATLDDFSADAFQGDMGLTSPMRPNELPNPSNLGDDAFPGVDLSADTVTLVALYVRLLDIPKRAAVDVAGKDAFVAAQCAACHVESLHTRTDFEVHALADIDAPVFSDLLVHDMGAALADGMVENQAQPSEWRTAPLIGIRHLRSFLHDGRAKDLESAIAQHAGVGSEANASVAAFMAMDDDTRAALVRYVKGL